MLIDNGANVLLKPGVYIIKGGTLSTKNSGTLKGTGVTLYFTGSDGHMIFDGTTTVSLSAPETGSTAGLLVMQDRAMGLEDFEISSKNFKPSSLIHASIGVPPTLGLINPIGTLHFS